MGCGPFWDAPRTIAVWLGLPEKAAYYVLDSRERFEKLVKAVSSGFVGKGFLVFSVACGFLFGTHPVVLTCVAKSHSFNLRKNTRRARSELDWRAVRSSRGGCRCVVWRHNTFDCG